MRIKRHSRVRFPLVLLGACSVTAGLGNTGVANAATYYVAPGGTGDGSESKPWPLEAVFDILNPGDTVILRGGVYPSQTLFVRRSGAPGSPIVYKAAPGELPILQGPGAAGIWNEQAVSHIVIEGLFVRNWKFHGVDLGRPGSRDIQLRHMLADSNGVGGLTLAGVTEARIESSISSRNGIGNGWSSNINMWNVQGDGNVVRGCVSFQAIDNSGQGTDGNGYIADLTLGGGRVSFENNIGFLNGGACIASTDSGGSRLIGNTCWHNAWDSKNAPHEFGFTDTCRGDVDGVQVGQKNWTFANVEMRNNVAVAQPGKAARGTSDGCNGWKPHDDFANSNITNNELVVGDGAEFFRDPANADFRPKEGSSIIGKAQADGIYPTDNGFDPKCIKRQDGQAHAWWKFVIDEDYVRAVGGVVGCFKPSSRTAPISLGALQDAAQVKPDGSAGAAGSGANGSSAGAGATATGQSGGAAGMAGADGLAPSGGAALGSSAGAASLAGAVGSGAETNGQSQDAGGCGCRVGSSPSGSVWVLGTLFGLSLCLRRQVRRK